MTEYIAIYDKSLIARGKLEDIVRQSKSLDSNIEPYVLELETCKRIEFSWRGDADSVIQGLPSTLNEKNINDEVAPKSNKRGRPKLGVKAKEVTLLPRHWEWLTQQRGGASVTLRRLVDYAMKNASTEELITLKQNQLYSLMSIFADEPGFEEATRALYRNSTAHFNQSIASWPSEIKQLLTEKFAAIAQLHLQGQEKQEGQKGQDHAP